MSEAEVTSVILRDLLKIGSQAGVPINVGLLTTAWAHSMPLTQEASFALLVQFDSPGAVEVQLDFEQANRRPTTELVSDPEYVIVENAEPLGLITDTGVHIIAFNPTVTRYGRLKLTGQGANDAATQLVRAELTYVRI
jgi:hypothetical protein